MRLATCALVLLSLTFFAWQPALADTVDQSNLPGGFNENKFSIFVQGMLGQTYTAGLTGNLTGLNLNIQNTNIQGDPALFSVAIYEVVAGLPSANVLGATAVNLPFGTNIFGQLITFPTAIAQIAGTQYAIVVSLSVPASCGEINRPFACTWADSPFNPYLGGTALIFSSGVWLTGDDLEGQDFHFQTHVDPVPEPGTLLLFGTSLAGLLLAPRARNVTKNRNRI